MKKTQPLMGVPRRTDGPLLLDLDPGGIVVVAGRQRVRAAQAANVLRKREGRPLLKIKSVVQDGEIVDALTTAIIENRLRRNDSPLAEARLVKRYTDYFGGKAADVALVFGRKPAAIRTLLLLLDAAPVVQRSVEAGQISMTAAGELARLPKAEQAGKLAEL